MEIIGTKCMSIEIDPSILESQIENYSHSRRVGYFLIDNHLIPCSFIDRLFGHIALLTLDYRDVTSVEKICGEEFWKSLKEHEREVVGLCLMMYVESGYSRFIPESMTAEHRL